MREGYSNRSEGGSRRSCINGIDDDNEDCDLSDFKPLAKSENINKNSYQTQEIMPETRQNEDDDQAIENFTQLGDVSSEEYYKQYVPYYTQMQGTQEEVYTDKDALMKKLNYMIHLLEEQQDEKTDNVTEELVLYLFLGVFVIFVVDSFARAGKYTR